MVFMDVEKISDLSKDRLWYRKCDIDFRRYIIGFFEEN